jgi:hypothetical protein
VRPEGSWKTPPFRSHLIWNHVRPPVIALHVMVRNARILCSSRNVSQNPSSSKPPDRSPLALHLPRALRLYHHLVPRLFARDDPQVIDGTAELYATDFKHHKPCDQHWTQFLIYIRSGQIRSYLFPTIEDLRQLSQTRIYWQQKDLGISLISTLFIGIAHLPN